MFGGQCRNVALRNGPPPFQFGPCKRARYDHRSRSNQGYVPFGQQQQPQRNQGKYGQITERRNKSLKICRSYIFCILRPPKQQKTKSFCVLKPPMVVFLNRGSVKKCNLKYLFLANDRFIFVFIVFSKFKNKPFNH